MRTIIYSGKGGVGKTSVAAATALRSARMGHRTIIMSVDTAHSLGDSFKTDISSEITRVGENLDVLEVNIIHEMRTKWSAIKDYVSALMVSQGMEDISAEEMAILPGMEMIAALFYVLQFKDSGEYDVVVIDTAPTGETLRLMSFPDVSDWYIDKVFGMAKRMISIARMTIGRVVDFPLPSKEVMESVERLKDDMERVKEVLEDSENTTIRLVLNPERMPINETMRAYTYLCLYNKTVECLVVNKVLPPDADGTFLESRLAEQAEYLELIDSSFDQLKVLRAYQFPTELRGTEKLDALADMIFGGSDPTEVYATSSPMRFSSAGGVDTLHLRMPFVDKSDIELFKAVDNSIIVQTGSQKRKIALPMTLADAELVGADFDGEGLAIRFRRKKE
jgi:arsenite-transporting ATPase